MLQEDGRPPKSFNLATGVSETLKVNPARRLLNIMMTGKHGAAKKVGNVINLHFEGNWMPIQVHSVLGHDTNATWISRSGYYAVWQQASSNMQYGDNQHAFSVL